ncbi:MAG TPA: nucleoside hydrolase, partial [Thermomicrobiales bacterium]|nr:nucleoside hydrolase [Thermomicrobiales bacterium]
TGVDDALAIAFAVRAGAYLVGVSTVAGNVPVDLATENTRRVLAMVRAESVPVHRGASRPLAIPHSDAVHVHGDNGLGGANLDESRAPESNINAINAILDAGDRHAGDLVIVALGPLTNIAIALSLRPELVSQVGRLVIMGGAFFVPGNVTPHAEFNIFTDPHAAEQVFAAPWADLVAVGLDVTHQTVFSREQWERIDDRASGNAGLVRRVTARSFLERRMDAVYLHDPLAVAVALDPSIVTVQEHSVGVETSGELRGKTMVAGGNAARIATNVDVGVFEGRFVEQLELPGRRSEIQPSRSE